MRLFLRLDVGGGLRWWWGWLLFKGDMLGACVLCFSWVGVCSIIGARGTGKYWKILDVTTFLGVVKCVRKFSKHWVTSKDIDFTLNLTTVSVKNVPSLRGPRVLFFLQRQLFGNGNQVWSPQTQCQLGFNDTHCRLHHFLTYDTFSSDQGLVTSNYPWLFVEFHSEFLNLVEVHAEFLKFRPHTTIYIFLQCLDIYKKGISIHSSHQ